MLDNLGQVLPNAARRFGDKTAVVCDGRRFSFGEMNALSARLASSLRRLGIEAGDRVTLYAQNRWEWIVSYYAVARVGAVVNPINVMLTPDEVRYVVQDCGATALIASPERGLPIVAAGAPPLREVMLFGDDAPAGTRSFNELLDASADVDAVAAVRPDELSTICYTSGTTGHPKGAMLTHRGVLLNAAMTANMHARTASDVGVHGLPLPHVYGNVIMNSTFLYGLTMIMLERFTAEEA